MKAMAIVFGTAICLVVVVFGGGLLGSVVGWW